MLVLRSLWLRRRWKNPKNSYRIDRISRKIMRFSYFFQLLQTLLIFHDELLGFMYWECRKLRMSCKHIRDSVTNRECKWKRKRKRTLKGKCLPRSVIFYWVYWIFAIYHTCRISEFVHIQNLIGTFRPVYILERYFEYFSRFWMSNEKW